MDPSHPRSHLECIGTDRTRCGYCKKQYTSANFGAWAHNLDVRDYQDMLDAGWRRSGSYLYRPDLVTTCCPSYVIRLDATRFIPSSTQKRVLKRLRRHANHPSPLSPSSSSVSNSSALRIPDPPKTLHAPLIGPSALDGGRAKLVRLLSDATHAAIDAVLCDSKDATLFPPRALVDSVRSKVKVYPPRASSSTNKKRKRTPPSSAQPESPSLSDPDTLRLTSNVALVIASAERIAQPPTHSTEEDVQNRAQARRKGGESNPQMKATKRVQMRRQMELASCLCRHLEAALPENQHVDVTEPGFLNFFISNDEQAGESTTSMHHGVSAQKCMEVQPAKQMGLPAGLQIPITPSEALLPQFQDPITAKTIPLSRIGSDASSDKTVGPQDVPGLMQTESSQLSDGSSEARSAGLPRTDAILQELSEGKSFTMELVPAEYRQEAYEIFQKYQMTVHHEDADQCTEETYKRFLVDSPLTRVRRASDAERLYGSYHMQYRLCGRLFAVGVVDILPKCLSSVYLFYDPEFAKLSPGTLSAVKEVEWVRRASTIFPTLRYYYMGYYIHSCSKMRYKAAFSPSEMLCEETKNWIPATDARSCLDSATGRVLRFAPEGMPPAPHAEDFRIDDETGQLTGDAIFQVNLERDGYRMLPYRLLDGMLQMQLPRQREAVLQRLRTFIRLVGKVNYKNYVHLL